MVTNDAKRRRPLTCKTKPRGADAKIPDRDSKAKAVFQTGVGVDVLEILCTNSGVRWSDCGPTAQQASRRLREQAGLVRIRAGESWEVWPQT